MSSTPPPPGPRAALVVVDVQRGFDDRTYWGARDNPSCEANIIALLTGWRETGRPVVFVRHDSDQVSSSLHPDSTGNRFKDIITGTPDLLVSKSVNSSFHGTPDLHSWLEDQGIDDVVICGITTNHCCETTARGAGNLGYRVHFPLDATHTFDRTAPDGERIAAATLSRITGVNLHGEFATVGRRRLSVPTDVAAAGEARCLLSFAAPAPAGPPMACRSGTRMALLAWAPPAHVVAQMSVVHRSSTVGVCVAVRHCPTRVDLHTGVKCNYGSQGDNPQRRNPRSRTMAEFRSWYAPALRSHQAGRGVRVPIPACSRR